MSGSSTPSFTKEENEDEIDEEMFIEDLMLSQKDEVLPSLISSFGNTNDISLLAKNIHLAIKFLDTLDITQFEDEVLRFVMPTILQTVTQIYNDNDRLQASLEPDIDALKRNIRNASNLLETCGQILLFAAKYTKILHSDIQSLPLNLAKILHSTFKHCRDNQKTYSSKFKLVDHILNLFKGAQKVHLNFLCLLDSQISFNEDAAALQMLLQTMSQISEVLAGINMKSMADNWKTFTTLTQKHSEVLKSSSFDILPVIRELSSEIETNMETVVQQGAENSNKGMPYLKMTGFLVKVVVKLAQIFCFENCLGDVMNLCSIIQRYQLGFFKTNNYSEEMVECLHSNFFENYNLLLIELFKDDLIIESLCALSENDICVKYIFGELMFLNEFLKNVPDLMETKRDVMKNFNVSTILCLVFNCVGQSFEGFIWDVNSEFYQSLITNISVVVLLHPRRYGLVERVLLKSVAQNHIWTAMVAMDCWCLILRHTSSTTTLRTFYELLNKIHSLHLGNFIHLPSITFLKMLVRKIFKLLPNSFVEEVICKYKPAANTSIWKILGPENIPISQRFHVEEMLNNLIEKLETVEKRNLSIEDVLFLSDHFHLLSNVNFNKLQIKASGLAPFINRLWSFDSHEVTPSNHIYKYFVMKLSQITRAIINEFVIENFMLILKQLKQLLTEPPFPLLTCEMLVAISKRNFRLTFHARNFISLIVDIFKILFKSTNPVIVQTTLGALQEVSNNAALEPVVNNLVGGSHLIQQLVISFFEKNAAATKYDLKCLEMTKELTFQHRCLQWDHSQAEEPQSKKIKLNDSVDEILNELKSNIAKLRNAKKRAGFSTSQMKNINKFANQLEMLI